MGDQLLVPIAQWTNLCVDLASDKCNVAIADAV